MEEILEVSTFLAQRKPDQDNSTKFNVETSYIPLDNAILDLAPKYLALDFKVIFKPKESKLLKDWRGCIRIEDQKVYFSDNYEASNGYELGNIYELDALGGFPECVTAFQSKSVKKS